VSEFSHFEPFLILIIEGEMVGHESRMGFSLARLFNRSTNQEVEYSSL